MTGMKKNKGEEVDGGETGSGRGGGLVINEGCAF